MIEKIFDLRSLIVGLKMASFMYLTILFAFIYIGIALCLINKYIYNNDGPTFSDIKAILKKLLIFETIIFPLAFILIYIIRVLINIFMII